MTRMISFGVLIAIILVIGLLFYRVMVGFFVPMFLAAVLCVVFRPLHRWVLERLGQRERTAAIVSTVLIMLVVLVPAILIMAMSAVQGSTLIKDFNPTAVEVTLHKTRHAFNLEMPHARAIRDCAAEIDRLIGIGNEEQPTDQKKQRVKQSIDKLTVDFEILEKDLTDVEKAEHQSKFEKLNKKLKEVSELDVNDLDFPASLLSLDSQFRQTKYAVLGGTYLGWLRETANPTKDEIEGLTNQALDYLRPKILSLTSATGVLLVQGMISMCIMIVAVYFFLYDGPAMIKSAMKLSPLDDRYEEELLLEFDRISRAVVLATLLSALAQGVAAAVGYYFCGIPSLMLLLLLTAVFSLVPVVGSATVWLPICIYLALFEERYWAAGLLAVWCAVVVGSIDNVVKAFVLHGQSQLHPLFAFLSVIGGVQALGPIGIVVGPMVVALLQTLLSILHRELNNLEDSTDAAATDEADGKVTAKVRKRGIDVTNATGSLVKTDSAIDSASVVKELVKKTRVDNAGPAEASD